MRISNRPPPLPLAVSPLVLPLVSTLMSVFGPNSSFLDFPAAEQQPPSSPPTLEEIDVTRHREIMSKAISAILLLLMKWFKVSRELPCRMSLAILLLSVLP